MKKKVVLLIPILVFISACMADNQPAQTPSQKSLYDAVYSGDLTQTKTILQRGPDLSGSKILEIAISKGKPMVQLLLERGAPVTALCLKNAFFENLGVFELLLPSLKDSQRDAFLRPIAWQLLQDPEPQLFNYFVKAVRSFQQGEAWILEWIQAWMSSKPAKTPEQIGWTLEQLEKEPSFKSLHQALSPKPALAPPAALDQPQETGLLCYSEQACAQAIETRLSDLKAQPDEKQIMSQMPLWLEKTYHYGCHAWLSNMPSAFLPQWRLVWNQALEKALYQQNWVFVSFLQGILQHLSDGTQALLVQDALTLLRALPLHRGFEHLKQKRNQLAQTFIESVGLWKVFSNTPHKHPTYFLNQLLDFSIPFENALDEKGNTFIHLAMQKKDIEFMKWLLENTSISILTKNHQKEDFLWAWREEILSRYTTCFEMCESTFCTANTRCEDDFMRQVFTHTAQNRAYEMENALHSQLSLLRDYESTHLTPWTKPLASNVLFIKRTLSRWEGGRHPHPDWLSTPSSTQSGSILVPTVAIGTGVMMAFGFYKGFHTQLKDWVIHKYKNRYKRRL